MPLAGTVDAAGLTPEAVARSISNRLAPEFVSPPSVTVAVTGLGDPDLAEVPEGAATIYVIGQVSRPGAYNAVLPIDILTFLALAGGPGTFAAENRIQIRRQGEDNQESVILFDYEAVQDGLVPTNRVLLQDGDVIVIPERRLFE
jgi:polysaccharide export outer membrane protein